MTGETRDWWFCLEIDLRCTSCCKLHRAHYSTEQIPDWKIMYYFSFDITQIMNKVKMQSLEILFETFLFHKHIQRSIKHKMKGSERKNRKYHHAEKTRSKTNSLALFVCNRCFYFWFFTFFISRWIFFKNTYKKSFKKWQK